MSEIIIDLIDPDISIYSDPDNIITISRITNEFHDILAEKLKSIYNDKPEIYEKYYNSMQSLLSNAITKFGIEKNEILEIDITLIPVYYNETYIKLIQKISNDIYYGLDEIINNHFKKFITYNEDDLFLHYIIKLVKNLYFYDHEINKDDSKYLFRISYKQLVETLSTIQNLLKESNNRIVSSNDLDNANSINTNEPKLTEKNLNNFIKWHGKKKQLINLYNKLIKYQLIEKMNNEDDFMNHFLCNEIDSFNNSNKLIKINWIDEPLHQLLYLYETLINKNLIDVKNKNQKIQNHFYYKGGTINNVSQNKKNLKHSNHYSNINKIIESLE